MRQHISMETGTDAERDLWTMTERINTEMWSVGLGGNDDTDGPWVSWQTCPDTGEHRLDTMNIYTWNVARSNTHTE